MEVVRPIAGLGDIGLIAVAVLIDRQEAFGPALGGDRGVLLEPCCLTLASALMPDCDKSDELPVPVW